MLSVCLPRERANACLHESLGVVVNEVVLVELVEVVIALAPRDVPRLDLNLILVLALVVLLSEQFPELGQCIYQVPFVF